MESGWSPTDLTRWLRRRRKLRAIEEGYPIPISQSDPDFYAEDGTELDISDRLPPGGWVVIIALVVITVFVFTQLGGGEGEEIIGSPPVSSSSSVTSGSSGSSTAPSSTPSTAPPEAITDARLRQMLGAIGIVGLDVDLVSEIIDLVGDWVDSISSRTVAYSGSEIDLVSSYGFLVSMHLAIANTAFNDSVYECGDTDPVVACPAGAFDMPAGDVLVVAMEVGADIPTASSDTSYRYSVVFDTDDDPANDWRFVEPFDWDYFQGTDRWYQAVYDHLTGEWFVEVTQLTEDGSFPAAASESAVRFVIDGPWGVWFIPVDELGGAAAPFRVTAFAHDGAFSEDSRGGDVSGVDPTGALIRPPTEPALVTGG